MIKQALTNSPYTLIVELFIQPDKVNLLHSELDKVMPKVLAEPTAISIQLLQNPQDTGHFTLIELWGSETHLRAAAHKDTDYLQAFFSTLSPWFTQEARWTIFQPKCDYLAD